MLRPVHHLQQLLQSWEDYCFLQQIALREHMARGLPAPGPYIGGVKNWQSFRQDVLNRRPYDERMYGLAPDIVDALQLFTGIPYFISMWSYHSRRVFRMSRGLQALLGATTARGITYADISLPFDSFVIEFETALSDVTGREFDAILVVKDRAKLTMVPLIRTPMTHTTLAATDRSKLRALYAQQRWNALAKLHGRVTETFHPARVAGLIIDLDDQGSLDVMTPIEKIFETCNCGRTHDQADRLSTQVVRLVVGFCLYLKTLPSGRSTPSDWTPLNKSARLDGTAVTNLAQICDVGSEVVISPEEMGVLEGQYVSDAHADDADSSHIELRAHFRMGHWRRPPGSGDDPHAPKIVHVRPTIVRRDRLAPGAIPSAMRAKLV